MAIAKQTKTTATKDNKESSLRWANAGAGNGTSSRN